MNRLRAFPRRLALAALALCVATPGATAKMLEEKIEVPVRVTTAAGKVVEHAIVVTLFRDSAARAPWPVLVLNHGRAAERAAREGPGRMRMTPVSTWFAELGFLVAVPTRVGYFATGGEDVEDSGPCKSKNYPPVYAASAAQTLQVLDVLRARRNTDRNRAVVVGQSFGGTTAITLAAQNPAGIQAAINFAGGGGGNPKTLPQNPCGQPQLLELFAGYGRTARVPTLWIYSENDMYFGPRLPKVWFEAFRAAGGIGEFRQYPPHGEDGHRFFERGFETWKPVVLQFLRDNGYPGLAR